MPLDLADFKAKRGRIETLDYGDAGSLTFRWHPDRLTDEVWNALQDPGEKRDVFGMANRIIVPLVSEWDVTEGGKTFPITPETVGSLGLFVVSDMVERIQQQMDEVKAETKKASGGG